MNYNIGDSPTKKWRGELMYLASGRMIFLLALAAGVIFDFSIAIR